MLFPPLIFLLLHTSSCSRIIFLNMFDSKSHALTMMPLAERLADDGHNVSMYSICAHSLRISSGKVKMIESLTKNVRSGDDGTVDTSAVSRIFWNYEMLPYYGRWCYQVAALFLQQGKDATLDEVLSTPYDMAIVDESYSALQGSIALKLKEKFETKMVAFATTELMPVAANMRGFARNPVTAPNTFMLSREVYDVNGTEYLGRVRKIFDYVIDQVSSGPMASAYNEESGRLLGMEGATKSKMFKNFLFTVNDFPDTFSFIRPRGNDLIPVGEHCSESSQLHEEFREFVEDPDSKGTIYVAFGSYINLEDGPQGTVDEFLKALNHFEDYRVIWSHKGNVTGTKCHVKVVRWAPQKELLAHWKTRVFLTHGGLKSAKEGVCAGVPMLFMPFYGDQPRNAHRFVTHRIAEALHKHSISAEDIVAKLKRLLGNPSYKQRIDKIRSFYMDSPMSALDLGAFHVSRALRFSQKHFFRFQRHSIQMNHLEYLNIDVLLFVICVLYLVYKP